MPQSFGNQYKGILANSLHWWDAALNPPSDIVYSPGDIAWVLASTALVWIMVPGVGFFYSGLLRCVSAVLLFFFSVLKTTSKKDVKMLYR